MSFEKRPLSKEEVSPQVFKLTGPDAPIKMKKITAKGVAPGLDALDLVTALYQLHISGDQELSKTATRSMTELPDSVVEASVESEDLHEMVLDLVAHTVVGRPKMVQKIILNNKVADESLLTITPKLSEQEIEILARNERRLLSCPPIIEEIYLNRNTRMSTANRCIEFAARNKLELKLPAYKEMLKAIGMETTEKDPIDQALMEEEKNLKFKNALDGVGEADLEEEEEDGKKSKGRIQLEHLSVSEKIRLAITGNVFHRSLLMRDSNKMVAMAAIKSPLVTEMEVVRLSKNPQTPEDALRYIARQREWIKLYQVKSNLVANAKTPLDLALKLVSHLRPKELKFLSRSKNISAALRNAAVARLRKKKA